MRKFLGFKKGRVWVENEPIEEIEEKLRKLLNIGGTSGSYETSATLDTIPGISLMKKNIKIRRFDIGPLIFLEFDSSCFSNNFTFPSLQTFDHLHD